MLSSWFVLRFFVGWTGIAVVLGGAATVSATHGFAKGLRGLNAHPPPRAGRLLTLVVVGANGLVGAVAGSSRWSHWPSGSALAPTTLMTDHRPIEPLLVWIS